MGITKRSKNHAGITVTPQKLKLLIAEFLSEHEVDMTADYRPQEEVWRLLLADAIAMHVLARTKIEDND